MPISDQTDQHLEASRTALDVARREARRDDHFVHLTYAIIGAAEALVALVYETRSSARASSRP